MDPYIEHETGQFPLSIGSSLALEGLFGIHPANPYQPPVTKQINAVWINLRTLVRNLYASVTTETLGKIDPRAAGEIVLEECQALQAIFEDQYQGRYRHVLYLANHDEVPWRFPKAIYRRPSTDKQLLREELEVRTLAWLKQALPHYEIPLTLVDREPTMTPERVAFLTHYPHELLWESRFTQLFLLESHTGKIKPRAKWATKMTGVSAEDHIAFNAFTLQLFGDGTMFKPHPKRLKDEVRKIAETRNWTAVTTITKMRGDIMRHGGDELQRTYNELMRRL